MTNLPMGEPRVVWYHEDGERYDAEVIRYHSPSMIDVDIIYFGAIQRRTSVALVATGVAAPKPYAERPSGNDLPDLDKVQRAKEPKEEKDREDS